MIDAGSAAAGLLAAALALARRMQDGEDDAAGEGFLTPALQEQLAQQAPQMTFRAVTVGPSAQQGNPGKVAESNLSPRRRVILQNVGSVALQYGSRQEDLPDRGLQLVAGAAFIDEPPYPHAGEWWAWASTDTTLVIGEQQ